MRRIPALLLLLPAALLGCEPAAEPTIGVRNAHALAYDGTRQGIVLFGGADESQVRGDTWIWKAQGRWARLETAGPEARTFPAMAYDEVRREVVLFGGNRVLFGTDADEETFLDDTWVLGAYGWNARPGPGPTARSEAAMTFDPLRGRIVLFGGSATVEGERPGTDEHETPRSRLRIKSRRITSRISRKLCARAFVRTVQRTPPDVWIAVSPNPAI